MPVECARVNDVLTHLYIANDGKYQGGDKRFYDLGTLYIGTQGLSAETAAVAEIWITYDITLFKPRLATQLGPPTGVPVTARFRGEMTTLASMFNAPNVILDEFSICNFANNAIYFTQATHGKYYIVALHISGNANAETLAYPSVDCTANYVVTEYWWSSPASGYDSIGVAAEAHAPANTLVSSRVAVWILKIAASSTLPPGAVPSIIIDVFTGLPASTTLVDCFVSEIANVASPLAITRDDLASLLPPV